MKGKLNRDLVDGKEGSYLTAKEGTVVYMWTGPDYGCVTSEGVPVTLEPDKTPFAEVPEIAVDWDD